MPVLSCLIGQVCSHVLLGRSLWLGYAEQDHGWREAPSLLCQQSAGSTTTSAAADWAAAFSLGG